MEKIATILMGVIVADETSRNHKRRTITSSLVIPDVGSTSNGVRAPECVHGPALRFSRQNGKSGESREFYACSVTRDRKVCGLFHWVDEWVHKAKRGIIVPKASGKSEQAPKKLKVVPDCAFATIVDNKTNAQFVFDMTSVATMVNIVSEYIETCPGSKRVLCLGTPTIHKGLLATNIESTLLDEDSRLVDMFPNTYRFNMFNGSWFGGNICPFEDDFSMIIFDPPFHPELLMALKSTLISTFPKSYANHGFMVAYPYYFSKQLSGTIPEAILTDIRLTYANHPKMRTHDRSPVRLYMSRPVIEVMTEDMQIEGHKYCQECRCHVSQANMHCDKCNKCTTLAGKNAPKHCDICNICAKPKTQHCFRCNKCVVASHSC